MAAITGALLAGGGAAFASSGAATSGAQAPGTATSSSVTGISTTPATAPSTCLMTGAAYGRAGLAQHASPGRSNSDTAQPRGYGPGQGAGAMSVRGTGIEYAPGGPAKSKPICGVWL